MSFKVTSRLLGACYMLQTYLSFGVGTLLKISKGTFSSGYKN